MKTADLTRRNVDDANQCAPKLVGEKSIVLRQGELRSWKGARVGTTIRARVGSVWLTQEGDPRDVILSAGECFRVTSQGQVLFEALQGPAQVGVASTC